MLTDTIKLRTKEEINLNNKLSLNKDSGYKTSISNIKYNKELIKIATYLIILKKPKNINRTEFYKFKREVLKYRVYSRRLWRILIKDMPIKLIVNKKEI